MPPGPAWNRHCFAAERRAAAAPGSTALSIEIACPAGTQQQTRPTPCATAVCGIVVKFEEINLKVQKVRKNSRCNKVRKSSRSTVTAASRNHSLL